MMNKTLSIAIAIALAAGIATVGSSHSASADEVKSTGLEFKAAYASQASCLSRSGSSYAGVQNTCSYRVEVVAWIPIVTAGWKDTSVFVFGNNTWCQTVATNDVGNGANIGSTVWTTAGPETWQSLNTGSRYVWSWSPLLVRCGLDAGETIGAAHAQW